MKTAWDFRHLKGNDKFINPNDLPINVNDLRSRLWPAENDHAGWSAKILVLGQDWAGSDSIIKNAPTSYIQDPKWGFNKQVKVFYNPSQIFLANVCWFIKAGASQGSLTGMGKVKDANKEVLDYTLKKLSSLKEVHCLGIATYRMFGDAVGTKVSGVKYFDSFQYKGVKVVCLPHPGNRGLNDFVGKSGMSRPDAIEHIRAHINGELRERINPLSGFNPFYIK